MEKLFYMITEQVQVEGEYTYKAPVVEFFKKKDKQKAEDYYVQRRNELQRAVESISNPIIDFKMYLEEVDFKTVKRYMKVQDFEEFFNIEFDYTDIIFDGTIGMVAKPPKTNEVK